MYYQKKSKRGVGHIEIIISFLIFTAFVLFILFFFRPTDTNRLINTSIDYVFLELKRNASVDVEQYSFKINTDSPTITDTIALPISDISFEKKSIAEDKEGRELPSRKIGLDRVIVNRGSENFITLLFSEDFPEEDTLDETIIINPEYYTPGVVFKDSLMSERRLRGVIEYYNDIDANYLELKKDFNLPDRVNFGISLILEGDEVEEEIKTLKLPPEGLEVFTEKRRTQILMEDGKREFVDIEVTIW